MKPTVSLLLKNKIDLFFRFYELRKVIRKTYSTTPLSRALKGPKKSVWLKGSLTYPNFNLSQTLLI